MYASYLHFWSDLFFQRPYPIGCFIYLKLNNLQIERFTKGQERYLNLLIIFHQHWWFNNFHIWFYILIQILLNMKDFGMTFYSNL